MNVKLILMKLRTGIFINVHVLQDSRQLKGSEIRRFPGPANRVCSKQLLHSLISFLPFPRDPDGLSTVSGEANLANRLQQLPLNSHGGTTKAVFSFNKGKGEFLIPHSEHREVF